MSLVHNPYLVELPDEEDEQEELDLPHPFYFAFQSFGRHVLSVPTLNAIVLMVFFIVYSEIASAACATVIYSRTRDIRRRRGR